MIYKIKQDGTILEFNNISEMGVYASQLPDATQEQINSHELSKSLTARKMERLQELEIAYNNTKSVTVQNGVSFSFTYKEEVYSIFNEIIEKTENGNVTNPVNITTFFYQDATTKRTITLNLMNWSWWYIFQTYRQNRLSNKKLYERLKAQITIVENVETLDAYNFTFTNASGLSINIDNEMSKLATAIKNKSIVPPDEVINSLNNTIDGGKTTSGATSITSLIQVEEWN